MKDGLLEHMQGGATTVCRCWKIDRKDGVTLGFTDHDEDIRFDDVVFHADSGLTASALDLATGLSVDNTEAVGLLDSELLTETDIKRGNFDGARVLSWIVNWANPDQRAVIFRGSIGEISWGSGEFRAELRGLSEPLGQSRGRVFQKPCSAVLGDARCGVDIGGAAFRVPAIVDSVVSDNVIAVTAPNGYPDRWFERGHLEGAGGHVSQIKMDDLQGGVRKITLGSALFQVPEIGASVTLVAGCDRRLETCRVKFDNVKNFQGFPDIPGEDWMTQLPASGQAHDGGSRR